MKTIAIAAPIAGILATCVRWLDHFEPFVGNKGGFASLSSRSNAESLGTTAAGLLAGMVVVSWYKWRTHRAERFNSEMTVAVPDLVK